MNEEIKCESMEWINEIERLKQENRQLENRIDHLRRRVTELEGENHAFRFVIRCNGVSGENVMD